MLTTPRSLAIAALGGALAMSWGCINLDGMRLYGDHQAVAVGPGSMILAFNEPELDEPARLVRRHVDCAGLSEPWPMLSLDGLGLIVEDLARAGPTLVWSDWQRDEPVELPDVTDAQLISPRHFIADAPGERVLISLDAPDLMLPVDPAFDPLLVRALPEHGLWAAIVDGRLLTGDLAGGIALDGARRIELPAPARQFAVFESEGVALVELADGFVIARDLCGSDHPALRLQGVIDWPYIPRAPLLLDQGLPVPSAGVIIIGPEARMMVNVWSGPELVARPAAVIEVADGADEIGLLTAVAPDRPLATLLGAPEWHGVVWPPAPLKIFSSSAVTGDQATYLALTPWPRTARPQ